MNNKFYVIEIAKGDSKIAGKSIYEYNSLNDAKASYHKKLGTAMSSELYTEDLVMVIDDYGSIYCTEKYIKEVPTPVEE